MLLSTNGFPWGQKGHRIVGAIAQDNLTEVTKRNVQSLLGNNTLASVSTWADEIRRDRDETYNWHFVDIPKDAAGFSDARDCFRPEDKHTGAQTDHQNCVVDRIETFKKVLADRNASREDRIEALKFIVHFVGDIHQPFHAVGEARGGNDIHVSQFGSADCGRGRCNLHAAWDSGLIEHTGLSEEQYVARLEELIRSKKLKASGNPADWANESHHLVQAAWLNDGGAIDDRYYNEQIKVVDEQLALAGLRLAAILNDVFGQASPQEFKRGAENTSVLHDTGKTEKAPSLDDEAYAVYSAIISDDWVAKYTNVKTLPILDHTSAYEMCLRPAPEQAELFASAISDYNAKNAKVWPPLPR